MAGSHVQTNNRAIEFDGKAEREFVKATQRKKVKKLSKHVRHAAKRGLVSEKALKKLTDEA